MFVLKNCKCLYFVHSSFESILYLGMLGRLNIHLNIHFIFFVLFDYLKKIMKEVLRLEKKSSQDLYLHQRILSTNPERFGLEQMLVK